MFEQFREQLTDFLRQHPLFGLLDEESLRRVRDCLEVNSFTVGQPIFNEGDPGDSAFLIHSGKVRVFHPDAGGKPVTLAVLSAGDLIGEHALLKAGVRTASVRASEDSLLCRIPRDVFLRLVKEEPELGARLELLIRQRGLARFLARTALLRAVPAKQLLALLDRFELQTFAAGATVFRQGSAGERMYFLQSGELKVVRNDDDGEFVLAYLSPGDWFGERALVLREPRYASVVALTAAECAGLTRADFEGLLAAHPQARELLAGHMGRYPADEEMARAFGARRPAPEEAAPSKVVWEKLERADVPVPARPRASGRRLSGLLAPFPVVLQQDETDCGLASLAMVARYHGIACSLERLRDLAHVDATGASMHSLTDACQALGFGWRAVTTDYEHLQGLSLPAIAHWKGHHYLVIYRAGTERVVLGDPAVGLVRLTRPEFVDGWNGNLLLLTPDAAPQVPSAKTPWQCLAPFLARFRRLVLAILAQSAFLALLWVGVAVVCRQLVDDGQRGVPWLAALAAGGLLLIATSALRRGFLQRLVSGLRLELTQAAFERLARRPLRAFQGRPASILLDRFVDGFSSPSSASLVLAGAWLDLLLVPAALVALLAYAPELALPAAGAVALAAGLCGASTPGMVRASQQRQNQEEAIRSFRLATIGALPVLKDMTAEPLAARAHRRMLAERPAAGGKRLFLWVSLVFAAAAIAFVALGAHRLQAQHWSAGHFVAAQGLLGLAAYPVLRLTFLWPLVVDHLLLLRNLADLEAAATEAPAEAAARSRRPGAWRLKDVAFRHQPEGRDVLADIQLAVEPGKVSWVVGRSGSGKTTLAEVLAGFRQPTQGQVTFDGSDLREIDPQALRARVTLVATEPTLLPGTVRSNIALSDPDAPLERVVAAAKLADAHDFIMRLPGGYEAPVGPGGVFLSRSRKQRLCLARAFLKEPPLLILDEATALLDAEPEAVVLRNLRWLGRDGAVLILTRRPTAAEPDDPVAMLDEGRITIRGSHQELLRKHAAYASLARHAT